AIGVALGGALLVSRLRDPLRAWRWGLAFSGAAFACTVVAWLGFHLAGPDAEDGWGFTADLLGRPVLHIDELSAPLLPVVGLLHVCAAAARGGTKWRGFPLAWPRASGAARRGVFACPAGWLLVGLAAAETVPAYLEVVNRGKPARVYLLHMALFVGLLAL